MKNLLSRDEYLQDMNEGFIGDTIKKGINAVKSAFRIGMKKIKDIIAVFDGTGKVLPVVTPQAVIDKFSSSDSIHVYTTPAMNETVVAAGGEKGGENPVVEDNGEIYDEGPKGKEYAKWLKEKKYKDSVEYKNFMSIPSIIEECYGCSHNDAEEIFEDMIGESWDGVVQNRSNYGSGNSELAGLRNIDIKKFKEYLNKMVDDTIFKKNMDVKRNDAKAKKPWRNMLVFGAPGIGKSTVPKEVIKEYNGIADSPAGQLSLITVDCTNIAVGDFMMPTMPQPKMVQNLIKTNPESFPQAKAYLDGLTPEQEEKLDKSLDATKQFETTYAPQSWLPSYKKTGDDELDALLDTYANAGVYTDDDKKTHKTGNGGIIMFDEFLRTDPNVFKQLMIFLLEREMGGWSLGSKWVIIACSNRPCDDAEVEEVWGRWNGLPAGKSRFERIFHLTPDPEQWKEWARSKGCDELLLKFIFDDSSKVGDEYPRWHTISRDGSGDSLQIKPITPRDWSSAFQAINNFEIDEELDDISEMSRRDIYECISGIFDADFVKSLPYLSSVFVSDFPFDLSVFSYID